VENARVFSILTSFFFNDILLSALILDRLIFGSGLWSFEIQDAALSFLLLDWESEFALGNTSPNCQRPSTLRGMGI
jgi:hypothetical protein